MDCVTECPDTAILGKVIAESISKRSWLRFPTRTTGPSSRSNGRGPRKYYDGPKKQGLDGGRFAIIIDPQKCKGCAECVTVCDDNALKMIPKTEPVMDRIRKSHRMFKQVGPSDERYINDNLLVDMMLKEQTHVYVGGAGSWPAAAKGPRCGCLRRHRGEVRRSVGHRRGHRLQHCLHLDVSL